MTGTVFWRTGATVWALVALTVVAAIGEVLHGLAVTISWLRFVCAVSRVKGVNGFKWLPTILFVRWWHFIGWRKGREAWEGPEGYWRGIGDWNVTPPNHGAERQPVRAVQR